ncbi:MAG TPA: Rieske 2Fe-2S domain-containing protein [Thermoanaerobaculia bacterium]|nr:Rieske 2Fe-2S domain-containing protein [Thermoanaerobaculia bacterium]
MLTTSRPSASASALRPPGVVPFWYLVCASDELKRGGVMRIELAGMPIVLFRGRETGVVHALPAHCLHQGVDLVHGHVVRDCLRCPLHQWEYSDRCERIPGSRPSYRAAERYGMIFLHLGADPEVPIPGFSVPDEELYFVHGKPVVIECPWYVPIANAFDMIHLQTVHRRALKTRPEITRPDPSTFFVRYSTRVIGDGWSDRAMRYLSNDDIRVKVICKGGSMLMVESEVGRRRSFLMTSLRPTKGGVSILPLFGTPRTASRSHLLHARAAAALFTAFLRRDIAPLQGIRFPDGYIDTHDETVTACYQYLCGLPGYSSEEIS